MAEHCHAVRFGWGIFRAISLVYALCVETQNMCRSVPARARQRTGRAVEMGYMTKHSETRNGGRCVSGVEQINAECGGAAAHTPGSLTQIG